MLMRKGPLTAGLLILTVLILYMCVYTVRFTERAVVTTLGKATERDVVVEPGLKFKLPPPIQNVTKYDSRERILNLKIETQQTADNRQVAVETFCTWRVSDPLKFYQTFSSVGDRSEEHYAKAEDALRANLRAAAGVVSQYPMEALFTTSSTGSKLPELEKRMLAAIREAQSAGGEGKVQRLADYGIEAVDVGLTRILLPQEVSKAVFDRMKASRDRLTKEIESQGQSQAQAIRERATADAGRIKSFASTMAESIRRQGDVEASQFIAQMKDDPELAVFLEKLRFIRDINPRTTTLVFSTGVPGLDLLSPNASREVGAGVIPGAGNWVGDAVKPAARRAAPGVQTNAPADIRDQGAGSAPR